LKLFQVFKLKAVTLQLYKKTQACCTSVKKALQIRVLAVAASQPVKSLTQSKQPLPNVITFFIRNL
jgi:hypothetical protein